MQLPNSLKRYKNEAKELILRGNIAEKYFTGFAYHRFMRGFLREALFPSVLYIKTR